MNSNIDPVLMQLKSELDEMHFKLSYLEEQYNIILTKLRELNCSLGK